MATYDYPTLSRKPSSMTLDYQANTDTHRSPLSGAMQTVDRGGEVWVATITYNSLKFTDRANLFGFLAKLNGKQHRVTLPHFGVQNLGEMSQQSGVVVNGANQTGNTLICDNAGSFKILYAGDFFSVNGELKCLTQSCTSDGSGNVTLVFSPRLRQSPADNAAVEVTEPEGTFMLAQNNVGWNYRPGDFSDFQITFIEDIAA